MNKYRCKLNLFAFYNTIKPPLRMKLNLYVHYFIDFTAGYYRIFFTLTRPQKYLQIQYEFTKFILIHSNPYQCKK